MVSREELRDRKWPEFSGGSDNPEAPRIEQKDMKPSKTPLVLRGQNRKKEQGSDSLKDEPSPGIFFLHSMIQRSRGKKGAKSKKGVRAQSTTKNLIGVPFSS